MYTTATFDIYYIAKAPAPDDIIIIVVIVLYTTDSAIKRRQNNPHTNRISHRYITQIQVNNPARAYSGAYSRIVVVFSSSATGSLAAHAIIH